MDEIFLGIDPTLFMWLLGPFFWKIIKSTVKMVISTNKTLQFIDWEEHFSKSSTGPNNFTFYRGQLSITIYQKENSCVKEK